MNLIKRASAIFILLFFTSCTLHDEADTCLANKIDALSLETVYGCSNTKNSMHIGLTDDFTVIQSQSEFDALVTGTCLPQIDFTIYDLVIGKKGLPSGNTSIAYNYNFDCDLQELVLAVIFYQNATSVAPNLTYHALIPKLENEEAIEIEIVLN